tara:strand:+ start:758 stop:1099 length:342 start_codon:yes stop_codon:yes gene_type:complete
MGERRMGRQKSPSIPNGEGNSSGVSYWLGNKLSYIEARKAIYIPLYSSAVAKTSAFRMLKDFYETAGEVWLWDFDGYDHVDMDKSHDQVVNDPNMKMGHAFVLAMLLDNQLPL